MAVESANKLKKLRIENIRKELKKSQHFIDQEILEQIETDLFTNNKLVDAEILAQMKKARNGCIDSLEELSIAYTNGVGVQENQAAAENYITIAFNKLENIPENFQRKSGHLSVLVYIAIEMEDIEKIEEVLITYLRYVIDHVSLQYWNWELLADFSNYYLQDEEED